MGDSDDDMRAVGSDGELGDEAALEDTCSKRKQDDAKEDSSEEAFGDGTASGSCRGRKRKKARTAKSKGGKNGGRPKQSGDNKQCADCKECKPLNEFKLCNAVCITCLCVKDNIYRACKREGCLDWYQEQLTNASKWKKVKRWYKLRCPAKETGAPGVRGKGFPVMQFIQQVKLEESQIRDGVVEMMHLAAFIHHHSKAKNHPPKGLTEVEATRLFESNVEGNDDMIDSVVDFLGEFKGYEQRVGVRTKTLLIDRTAEIKSQGYDLKDKEVKKTTQMDIDKAHLKMHTKMDEVGQASNSMTRAETTKFLAKHIDDRGGPSAFDGQLSRLGGIKSLSVEVEAIHEEALAQASDDPDGNSSGSGEETGTAAKKNKSDGADRKKTPEKKEKIWFNKEIALADAVRTQNEWRSGMETTLRKVHGELIQFTAEAINDGFASRLGPEMRFAAVRTEAIGAVLGLTNWEKRFDNQEDLSLTATNGPSLTAAALAAAIMQPTPDGAANALAAGSQVDAASTAGKDATSAGAADSTNPKTEVASTVQAAKPEDTAPTAVEQTAPAAAAEAPAEQNDSPAKAVAQSVHSSQGLNGPALLHKKAARAMKAYIARFRDSGNTPPCRSYRNLVCLAEFSSYFERIPNVTADNEIKAIKSEMVPFKNALNDLVTMGRNASESFSNSLTKMRKAKVNDTKAKTPKNKASSGGSVLFERVPEKGTPIATFEMSILTPTDRIDKPFIVTGVETDSVMSPISPLPVCIDSFKAKFAKSTIRNDRGRAERPLKGPPLDEAQILINRLVLAGFTGLWESI